MREGIYRNICLGFLLVCCGILHAVGDETPSMFEYTGFIREDATENEEVTMDQDIMPHNKQNLAEDEIYGYTIYKSHSEMPFKVVISDRTSGLAKIILAPGYKLNYERRHRYSFEIAAHDRTGEHAARERVRVTVKDVNEFPPVWTQETNDVTAVEKIMYTSLLKLETTDEDGSDLFSSVCNYHLLTPNVPFEVNSSGILRNTEPLDYSRQHNFILEVKAEDCGHRMSNSTVINVIVKPQCRPGWADVSERVDFTPGSLKQLILPDAHLDLCDDLCDPSQIIAKVKLETLDSRKGCDRDPYSIQSQRTLCGASTNSVDLLPVSTPVSGSDNLIDNDQIFAFDGLTNAVEVPPTTVEPHLGEHFTITTWMKHESDPDDVSKHGKKEHILCHSDGEDMNRHHYSLFVRNCRLVLLFRKEAAPDLDMNKFQPAEWRWKIPQVCDGEWHHYAVSVNMPQVALYIDGHLHVESKGSPEVIDDWPLHSAHSVHYTKLVVGACWHGGAGSLGQYFRGHLAGLSLLKGETEHDSVIQCLNRCQEKLDFHAMADMQTGMSVSLNSELTEITITGHNVAEVEKLLRQVGYANPRVFAASGHRTVSLVTDVSCPEDEEVDIPDFTMSVFVAPVEQPVISVSGSPLITLTESALEYGEAVLADVVITSHTHQEEEALAAMYASKLFQASDKDLNEGSRMALIDSCLLRVNADLKPDIEHFKYPLNLIAQLGLQVSETDNSFLIAGADTAARYQKVFRQIRYVHARPQDLSARTFIVSCSAVGGKYVSNEFITKLSVIHTSHDAMVVPQAQGANHIYVEPMKSVGDLNAKDAAMKATASGSTSIGVVVIIVVCVGFLLFMIVLGVMRIRSSQQRGSGSAQSEVAMEERPEMEWDNSALTITVNPMDQDTAYDEEYEMNGLPGDDSDDDDASSYHDELESSEEETEKVKDRELEWDDSTLTF